MPTELTIHDIDLAARGHGLSAHVDQYMGAWAIYEPNARGLIGFAERINLQVHLQQQATPEARAATSDRFGAEYLVTRDGIAVIELNGTLMKHVSSASGGTSTVAVRRQLRAAARDEEVKGIMLLVDSPGGTVAGIHDLSADIALAGESKPVHSYFEDLAASAAYWSGSQSQRISAGPTTFVGSIGVLSVVHDLSKMAEKEGIEVHVITFGEHKGAGIPGAKVSEKQLAGYQAIVDGLGADFIAAIKTGRNVSEEKATTWADGRIYKAPEALDMGLIDAVESFDVAMDHLVKTTRSRGGNTTTSTRTEKRTAMSNTNDQSTTDTAPAKSFDEQLAERRTAITAACPGAPEGFVAQQVAVGASSSAAATAWMAQLAADRDAATERAEKAEKSPPKSTAKGVAPLVDSGTDANDSFSGDAIAEWNQAVSDEKKAGAKNAKAIASARRKNPELHRAYVLAVNAQAGRPTGRFEANYAS